MGDELIYKKFKKKAEKLKYIGDLYNDKDFSKYYNEVIIEDKMLDDDIFIYKKYFTPNTCVLEIGSGTGRIFNNLFKNRYNIYGLEPSVEMNKYILEDAKKRIFNFSLQNIELIPIDNIEVIIIPATSVSLFSYEELIDFLKKIKTKQKKLKHIIFDFIEISLFEDNFEKIGYQILNDEKYYYVNYLKKDKIIFNILNSEKIGVSIKYNYSYEVLKNIFYEQGYSLNVVKHSEGYMMVEGRIKK